jgi:hypothetical protein
MALDETYVRQEVYRLFKTNTYWPCTQTDLNAPFDIATVNKLMGSLFKLAKPYPHITGVLGRLKAVLNKAVARPPKGRPDILVLIPNGRNRVCEVKVVPKNKKSFPFSNIEEKQRRWLDAWTEDGGDAFLAIGTLVPRQRRLWLVTWTAWRQLEETVSPIQESVPVVAGKGMRKELQENHYDMHTLLCDWELSRITGGWELSPKLGGILCSN